jgi:hypothetical protein
MIRAWRRLGWDFILAQKSRCHFRPLSSLPVTRHHPCQMAQVELFAEQQLAAIEVVAFYQAGTRTRQVLVVATSLALTAPLRRLGRRRWGTEPFYRDLKSSGWHLTRSCLPNPQRHEGLLVILAVTSLWAVCTGRWLCKTRQRCWLDRQPRRHLRLFRIGWDWLMHCLRCDLPCPARLRLYT